MLYFFEETRNLIKDVFSTERRTDMHVYSRQTGNK